MSIFKRPSAVTATFKDKPIACLVCGGELFMTRQIKLNSTGMEFLDLGWANASATGLICISCGFLHEFAGNELEIQERRLS